MERLRSNRNSICDALVYNLQKLVMKANVVKYLDLPIALVSLWVPPAPGMVPSMWLQIMVLVNLREDLD